MKKSLKDIDSRFHTNSNTHSTTSPREYTLNKKNSLMDQAKNVIEKNNLHKIREMLKNK
jgi:hypothetical protein